jgi:hypothetical protein
VDYVGDTLNDNVNSIIVISGNWKIYEHAGFNCKNNGESQYLKIGYYNSINLIDLIVKGISSAKCVKL